MSIYTNRQIWIKIYFLLIMSLPVSDIAAQEIAVGRIWVDLYGSAIWSTENPVEPGTQIQVFDSDNSLCGEFTVRAEGEYGFMAVYGDDPLTPNTDEGAIEGDGLSFMINGAPANILYGGSVVWSQQNMKIQVNLISTETGVENVSQMPRSFGINQNYPNPFNPVTSIEYQLPRRCFVTITIYNIVGQKVHTLVDEVKDAGFYESIWNGKNDLGISVSSGIYLYHINAGEFRKTRKLILHR